MWIRKTPEEQAEAVRKGKRAEWLWRLNPLLPLVFAAFGIFLQGYGLSPETPSLAIFVGVFVFLYAVQFIFGPSVAAAFMLGDFTASPSTKAAICPVCQSVQRFVQTQGV